MDSPQSGVESNESPENGHFDLRVFGAGARKGTFIMRPPDPLQGSEYDHHNASGQRIEPDKKVGSDVTAGGSSSSRSFG